MFSRALRKKGLTTEVDLSVTTGAGKEGLRGYDPWRKRVNVSVKALPVKGRANKALIAFLADFFKIPNGDVKIIRFNTSHEVN